MTRSAETIALNTLLEPVTNVNPQSGGFGSRFKYIDIGAIDRLTRTITGDREISSKDAPSRARQLVKRGDVLVSTVRPNLNAVALVTAFYDGAVASTGFTVLRPNPARLNSRYLFHLTKSDAFVQRLVAKATGAGYPAVSDNIIKSTPMNLPEIAEQERIAEILDRVDAIGKKHAEVQWLAGELVPALFEDMFGEVKQSKEKWPIVAIGDITSIVTSGSTPRGGSAVYCEDGPIFVRSQNVLMNHLDLSDVVHIKREVYDGMARTQLQPGDVLLNITGASIGRVATFLETGVQANVSQHVCIIRPLLNLAVPEFVAVQMGMPEFQAKLMGSQTGASRQALNHPQVRGLKIVLPPIELQNRFCKLLKKIDQLKSTLDIRGQKTQQLAGAASAELL